MKKWIIVSVIIVVSLGSFVLFSNALNKEERLTSYVQDLYFNENNYTLEGKEYISFLNYSDAVLTNLCLHLYPNAFREGAKAKVVSLANVEKAYPNGKSYGNIEIESVSSCDGYLEYDIAGEDENILIVELGKELFPDEVFDFEIGFTVQLANVNHRLGYGENTINICNYYPILCVYENGGFVTDLYNSNGDPFYSKIANYEVSLTYSSKLCLASSGEQTISSGGDKATAKIKANKVRDFAMVLSSKFNQKIDEYKGVKLNYYYYSDTTPDKSMEVIKKVLLMNEKYGMYPYSTLTVCEANFVHGGMEYPNLVLIADNLADYDTYVNVIVHELCHQWWYGVVGNNQFAYGFLDEGLTDYNTAIFYDVYPEYGHSISEIFKNATSGYCHFIKVYNDVVPNFSTSMLRALNDFATENEYVYLSYVKGMLMFSSLRDLLGNNKMNKCLKYYYEHYKFKEATPYDLIDCFCKASGKNLNIFFNSWLNGDIVLGEFN